MELEELVEWEEVCYTCENSDVSWIMPIVILYENYNLELTVALCDSCAREANAHAN